MTTDRSSGGGVRPYRGGTTPPGRGYSPRVPPCRTNLQGPRLPAQELHTLLFRALHQGSFQRRGQINRLAKTSAISRDPTSSTTRAPQRGRLVRRKGSQKLRGDMIIPTLPCSSVPPMRYPRRHHRLVSRNFRVIGVGRAYRVPRSHVPRQDGVRRDENIQRRARNTGWPSRGARTQTTGRQTKRFPPPLWAMTCKMQWVSSRASRPVC